MHVGLGVVPGLVATLRSQARVTLGTCSAWKMPFLLQAPTSVPNNAGEAPKSRSNPSCDAGGRNAATRASVLARSSTIDTVSYSWVAPVAALPVVTKT